MESNIVIQGLAALAHEGRLAVFRALVRGGQQGLAAGEIARQLALPANTLSAQLAILSAAGLVNRQRDGRSIIYTARLDTLNQLVLHLIEDCCEGRDEVCAPILDALQATRC
ncbi:MAG: helix-turn-helix transcriptional regulator [Alphaproteobacteria bacterium]|nr:helix-turn-helix transcriptional regulator [Alphaproteobacteria bacterium]